MRYSSEPVFRRRGEIDAVMVFDLDDTLYLERDYVESGLHAVGDWAAVQLDMPALGGWMLDRFRGGQHERLFDDALLSAGIAASADLVARMLRVYRQHRPRIGLAADARRFLMAPPPRTGLAIITDGFLDAQRRKLRALGLQGYGIDIAVCTDRWGRGAWKPSRRAFDHVRHFFGVAPEDMTYVADNEGKDFHAPIALGWRTIQILRSGKIPRKAPAHAIAAEKIIGSFDEIMMPEYRCPKRTYPKSFAARASIGSPPQ